jgi:hypothetical protein
MMAMISDLLSAVFKALALLGYVVISFWLLIIIVMVFGE